jgi:thioredoxin reductase (NADPH)
VSVSASEAPALTGGDVYVLGGANSAGQAAMHLAEYAARVTLVVRATSLEQLVLRGREDGASETVQADALFVMIGARSNTAWLPEGVARSSRGFILTGADAEGDAAWPCARSPLALETSMPGVFAAGDVRQGSMSRVASAVGEGSIAIKLVHELFAAQQPEPEPARLAAELDGKARR